MADTRWCFEYGPVGSEGFALGSLPLAAGDAGRGTAAIPVGTRLTGLAPGTTYRYRLVALNSLDLVEPGSSACGVERAQEAAGAEATFTTPLTPEPPVAVTGAAEALSQNGATLSGTVNPDGGTTSYAFQIGIDTSYGVQLFGAAGAGREAQAVSFNVEYLQPGTTYHYRLVASNTGGAVYGADETFTTPVFPAATLTAPGIKPLVAVPDVAFPVVPGEGATVGGKATKSKRPGKSKKRKKKGRAGKKPKAHDTRGQGKAGSAGRHHAANGRGK